MQIGSLVRFRNTGVVGIVIKRSYCLERWRVLGIHNHHWYEIGANNQYVEVISESR